ncbi:TAXI family TRAP transporter solute-binding subunit [Corynebacterium sp. 35RC1]|nr:TAXI family TRAP transporter solute-binding subunit [Corynebacterium sp. 35RC1]
MTQQPGQVSRRTFLKGMGTLGLAGLVGACSPAPEAKIAGLPGSIVWSTYPAGTGTYNDVAAFANTLTSIGGSQVRLMTGDTGIGRIAPLISGVAHYARSGDETYYAFEGDDEFASRVWGPQQIRNVWTPPGNYGVLTRKDSGIVTADQLRGKRYPRLISSISMNRKLEAVLNFGGLTLDDVTLVDISYSEQADAIRAGHIDAMYYNVVGAQIAELNSKYPIHWINLGGGEPEQYSTWDELVPMVIPGPVEGAVGTEPGEVVTNFQYSIPLSTLAERPAEEVYTVLKTLHENFDDFKDATPDAKKFALDQILLLPLVLPFHEGAIRFLDEQGRWNESLQARNDALLLREERMREAWPQFWKENEDASDVDKRWLQWKKDNLPALPVATDPTSLAT